ncbi:MAG: hypothetical protein LBE50_01745 [Gallionellaceae bacterium]|jgi:hypothetical protein|nr:hypothetical protein [Gallionellaceae bacterium]
MQKESATTRIRHIVLSDHASDMVNKAREAREAEYLAEQAAVEAANKALIERYQGFVEMRNGAIRRAKETLAAARARKGFHPLAILWGLLRVFAAWFPAPPSKPVLYRARLKEPDKNEMVWEAGR